MEQIFIQLAILLFTAFAVSYIIQAFNQPIIIGYIVTGIIITPFIVKFGASQEIIHLFSEFGIAFLLFIVGLHLNPKIIKQIGANSLFIGLGQMILTFAMGFIVSLGVLGYNGIASIYIGIAIMFSSTIITMKLLSDKNEMESLHAKISIGVLIIQDLVAVLCLMVITSLSQEGNLINVAIRSLISGGSLIILLFLIGIFILPSLMKRIARNHELLFLFSICWCFAIAALFQYVGFSIEIGALLAGIILSTSPYSAEISSKIRPLRDFFLIIFFIILGLGLDLTKINSVILDAVILTVIVLTLKPLILMFLTSLQGYTKRTNFLVGVTLSQISEFSLIVVGMGLTAGHISGEISTTVTLTAILTIAFSTYLMTYSKNIYNKIATSKFLDFFERKKVKRKKINPNKKYDAILFGYNRIGYNILRSLKNKKMKYLVVDFDPDTISDLSKLGIPAIYGDSYDSDFLEQLPLNRVKLIISTVPDFETNQILIENVKLENPEAIIIVRASHIDDAMKLYKKGATYVLTPHFLGGEYLAKMLKQDGDKKEKYELERKKHIKELHERIKLGHKHPEDEED
jgi:Kef-type K+ transport system membrane component KefB